jgi:hypothetical protein
MKYWQPEYETMQKDEMRQLQLKRLKKTAASVYENVPFYNKKFKELVSPLKISIQLMISQIFPSQKNQTCVPTILSDFLQLLKRILSVFMHPREPVENPRSSDIQKMIFVHGQT